MSKGNSGIFFRGTEELPPQIFISKFMTDRGAAGIY